MCSMNCSATLWLPSLTSEPREHISRCNAILTSFTRLPRRRIRSSLVNRSLLLSVNSIPQTNNVNYYSFRTALRLLPEIRIYGNLTVACGGDPNPYRTNFPGYGTITYH